MSEAKVTEPYRPSNGTEGAAFTEHWCARCELDRAFREDPDVADGCSILADALALGIDDPHYPKEWRYTWEDDDEFGRVLVPTCSAFAEITLVERCKFTVDMFKDAP